MAGGENWMTGAGQSPVLSEDHFCRPSPARMWNYVLGGKDNYQVDRDAGDLMVSAQPGLRNQARQAREFLARAVQHVAHEGGVRQFLDIGCGLPVPPGMSNTHEVVQRVDPAATVVYVDSDKVVLAHARALLTSPGPGAIDYIDSDARNIEFILTEAEATLDFGQPVGVMFFGVLGAVSYDEARGIVGTAMDAVCSGSYLLFNDGADSDTFREAVRKRNNTGISTRYTARTPEEMSRYLDGLELVEPGLVPTNQWRPNLTDADASPVPVDGRGAVARKP
jgi:trans-aconitate methyltransferase